MKESTGERRHFYEVLTSTARWTALSAIDLSFDSRCDALSHQGLHAVDLIAEMAFPHEKPSFPLPRVRSQVSDQLFVSRCLWIYDSLGCRAVPTVERVHDASYFRDTWHQPRHDSRVHLKDGSPFGHAPYWDAHFLDLPCCGALKLRDMVPSRLLPCALWLAPSDKLLPLAACCLSGTLSFL